LFPITEPMKRSNDGISLVALACANPDDLHQIINVLQSQHDKRASQLKTARREVEYTNRAPLTTTIHVGELFINETASLGANYDGQLKNNPNTAAIPVISLSAHALAEHLEWAIGSEFDGYLTNPLDLKLLKQTLLSNSVVRPKGVNHAH
jgi:response regulator RpfG family c-di-GMP phosphodiesterase